LSGFRITALGQEDWDAAAATFDDVSYDQTAIYADSRRRLGRIGSLAVERGGVVVGMARLVRLQLPLIPGGVAYLKFGPLWRRTPEGPDPAIFRAVVEGLVEETCRRGGQLLTILPRPHPEYTALEAEMLRDMGFQVRRPMPDPIRYLVDLRLDSASQQASLGQKWRYHLRKALAAGLSVAHETGPAAIRTFRELHAQMLARKKFQSTDPVHLLDEIARRAPLPLRPNVVLVRKDGRAIAGAVIERAGSVATYVFGASNDEALELRAGYALQWWVVNWLRDQGKLWYDLGGAVSEPHLEQFKRGLVGKAGRLVELPGEFDYWTSSVGRGVADLVYRARELQRWRRFGPAQSRAETAKDA